jgi:hypothetical protein
MNYTSGPWEMVSKKKRKKYYEHGEKIIILGNGSCQFGLATVEGPSNFDKQEEMRANASLIAAAPELLEACQYALDNLAAASRDNLITAPKWFHVQLSETKLMLDSAIQKANGGK